MRLHLVRLVFGYINCPGTMVALIGSLVTAESQHHCCHFYVAFYQDIQLLGRGKELRWKEGQDPKVLEEGGDTSCNVVLL